ncbi:MAG: ABC transporter substrate-binding protein [Elusimicrobiales bacterium]|nr:ABC transporter substrate-binding protein [Elusimicrobiales bacterium]
MSLVKAERVVSLLPSYTETIFALGAGDRLVGVSNFCNRPAEAAALPKVGDYFSPDIERIYALRPDIVFDGRWKNSAASERLSALGLKVVRIPEERKVSDIYGTVRIIAAELGLAAEGRKLNARLRKDLAAASYSGKRRLRAYVEVDAGGWSAGGDSFISSLADLAGADNIFAREKAGYFQASWETVVKADPEVIICPGGDAEEIKSRPMADRLKAVRSGAVLCGLDRDLFARLTPSSPSAVKVLREALDAHR